MLVSFTETEKTASGPDLSRKTTSIHVEVEKPLKHLKRNTRFMGLRYYEVSAHK